MRQRKTVWRQEVGFGWCLYVLARGPMLLSQRKLRVSHSPSCILHLANLEHIRAQMCPAVQMGGLQPHFAANEEQLFSGQEASPRHA